MGFRWLTGISTVFWVFLLPFGLDTLIALQIALKCINVRDISESSRRKVTWHSPFLFLVYLCILLNFLVNTC